MTTTSPIARSIIPEYGTLFIATPGIEELRNYFLVQKLLEHRVRSMMTGIPFDNIARTLVEQYITPPITMQTVDQLNNFYSLEAQELYNSFAMYEQTPKFQEALHTLVPYKGKPFTINGLTNMGLQLIITLSEGS
ncbi:hypothetical protein D3C79_47710 [compost metagenome]